MTQLDVLLPTQSCQICYGFKRYTSKNTVHRYNKKSGKSGYFHTKRKVVKKVHRFGRHRIFQETMNRGIYEDTGL